MTLISFQFLIFVCMTAAIYFLFPRRYRWTVLLAASYAYYLIICNKYIIYMLITTVTTWLGGRIIGRINDTRKAQVKANKEVWSRAERKAYKEGMLKKTRAVMAAVLLLNFGILGVLKYSAFALALAEGLSRLLGGGLQFPDPGFLLPLGISFYTFQSMGYIIDVYQEKVEPETSPARFALFVSFFPQIIQGPIAMYDDLAHQLYEPHDFSFLNLKNGFALILWGMVKKMVIADRAVKLIDWVTEDSTQFSGTFILTAALLYALQLYADFSGGIDIVRGIAEILGIRMAENFRRPYFSASLTEYWHRWHITLGHWVRTYIFYPLSISKTFLNMGRKFSKKGWKHLGRVIPVSLASLITFLIIGIWHGANGKYVAFGLWNGGVIMLQELFRPLYEKAFDRMHIDRRGRGFHLVCVLWTFILVLIGYYFDIARDLSDAMSMLLRSVTDFHISQLFLTTGLYDCGLQPADYLMILLGGLMLYAVSFVQERSELTIRQMLWQRSVLTQALVLEAGILLIAVFGYYGPDLDPSAFVYMQF